MRLRARLPIMPWHSRQGCNFTVAQQAGQPILVQHSRQGLRRARQATCAMLHCLADDIWISFRATDVSKSAAKGFKAYWTKNDYQKLRTVHPERLEEVRSVYRGQLQARTSTVYMHFCPPQQYRQYSLL